MMRVQELMINAGRVFPSSMIVIVCIIVNVHGI
jgi:hypothetical protein